jgi:hypothetical protein
VTPTDAVPSVLPLRYQSVLASVEYRGIHNLRYLEWGVAPLPTMTTSGGAALDRDVDVCGSAPGQSALLLRRIAAILGEPEHAFLGPMDEPTAQGETFELLRIWHRLDDRADRQTLLAFARTLSARR